ncbi:O-antigen polysaccharide polymerase Wzy [Salipiger thiooxidans]|uniref:O-antigen polysaccharide polymerase Wzy n=1 Tax=Salipiger thiooxidans TaxID=282683 RepID=UPI001A8D8D8F|nr:O-antigen polysaccharide polymerase Wzy [Salipiger thiooxidans]MBN8189813.1 O-antigen polysaccharide polymerase Wzy [Salipiger thiooxidans]
MFLTAVLFAVALTIVLSRGLFATDTIFTLGVIMWHVPLILLAQFPNMLGPYLDYLVTIYQIDRYDDLVLQACIAAPLGFWVGGIIRRQLTARRRRFRTAVPRRWTTTPNYVYLFAFLWLISLGLNAATYATRGAGSYAQTIGSGAGTIHPVIDWFLIYCYLVMLLFFVARLPDMQRRVPLWRLSLAFLPLLPLFLSGSRQAFLGPILALVVMSLPLERRNKPIISVLFVLMMAILPFLSNALRMSRIGDQEVVGWGDTGGYVGFLFELGRTVRLVGWAESVCSRIAPDPVGYVTEALGRLVFLGGNFENLTVSVTGGGNGFTFIAEAICIAGPSAVAPWSLLFGLVLGFLFSVRLTETSDLRDRFVFAFYLSVGVMWPRDEVLAYVREMVWFGILPQYVLLRYVRPAEPDPVPDPETERLPPAPRPPGVRGHQRFARR